MEIELVTGVRGNLIKVESGERAMPASVEAVRLKRSIDEALRMWERFAYAEAAEMLGRMRCPASSPLYQTFWRAEGLSRAFAAWDCFDHIRAWEIAEDFRPFLGKVLPGLIPVLHTLTREGKAQEPARIFDLFLNAKRCAARGRFDDAVARLYRMVEWSAQWLLRALAGIDTADVPEAALPEGMVLAENRRGKRQAGLFQAWRLAAYHLGGEVAAFWGREEERLLDLIEARNRSILAHGFEPVGEKAWQAFSGWVEGSLIPVMLERTAALGVKALPPQLPQRMPELG